MNEKRASAGLIEVIITVYKRLQGRNVVFSSSIGLSIWIDGWKGGIATKKNCVWVGEKNHGLKISHQFVYYIPKYYFGDIRIYIYAYEQLLRL